nr:MAG TPA: hypothetical protein [Caudoviricetes sp.]DAV28315.1 MAG TPA: hypothetical protein [Caudoviricetes sp.]
MINTYQWCKNGVLHHQDTFLRVKKALKTRGL